MIKKRKINEFRLKHKIKLINRPIKLAGALYNI